MTATGVFHPGRQHSWHAGAALRAAGALGWYATSIYYDPARFPYSLAERLPGAAGQRLRRSLQRRATSALDPSSVRHLPANEWLELALARLAMPAASRLANESGNERFQRAVLRLVEREPVGRLWGYDTSCRRVFEAAGTRDTVRVLDQSIAHMAGLRDRLLADRERFPDLVGDRDIPSQADCDRSSAEIRSASHVLVGCDYAAALARQYGAPADRVHVCPYGYEEANFPAEHAMPEDMGKLPVRFVFVGTVSARKGFHLLARVFSRMSPELATLTIIGPSTIPRGKTRRRPRQHRIPSCCCQQRTAHSARRVPLLPVSIPARGRGHRPLRSGGLRPGDRAVGQLRRRRARRSAGAQWRDSGRDHRGQPAGGGRGHRRPAGDPQGLVGGVMGDAAAAELVGV